MGRIVDCVVCRRREPAQGDVCEPCRTHIADLLADLPRKVGALGAQQVPAGAGAGGEKVSTSKVESPLPARLDALSMLGPGADSVTAAVHPLVRRWSTTRLVQVTVPYGKGRTRVEDRSVVEWHRELARHPDGTPVQIPDDDQLGMLPPVEWVSVWARMWREHFGHHRLPKPLRRPGRPAHIDKVNRQETLNQLLGLDTHHRDLDPLAAEWETRFGEPARDRQPYADVRYLLDHLDRACDTGDELALGAMATELRALSSELTRILGERPDQQWLGRCPAQLVDRNDTSDDDAGPAARRVRTCGAGLWHEPYASNVECPRCHATWQQRELLHLAKEIRRAHPVDRRRRYTRSDVEHVALPDCPTCGRQVDVTWRNVTATGDDTMWWQPDRVLCPNGCPDVERIAS